MATNPAASYGRDVLCMDDATDLWESAEGLAAIIQDTYHRLTNDTVFGDDEFGYDVSRLVGMKTSTLGAMGPVLSEVVQRDDRIETADVGISVTRSPAGIDVVRVTVKATTARGPFSFVVNAADLTVEILNGAS